MVDSSEGVVLVVEDERDQVDLYTEWLNDEHTVLTAYTGTEALALLDDGIDVVLLDRRIPAPVGDEILEEIRSRDLDCCVAMVTAVDPDFDVVDMDVDAYLTKPFTGEAFRETVDGLIARSACDDRVQTYFALSSKRAALEAEKLPSELDDSEEYARLRREISEFRREVAATLEEFDDADLRTVAGGLAVPDREDPLPQEG